MSLNRYIKYFRKESNKFIEPVEYSNFIESKCRSLEYAAMPLLQVPCPVLQSIVYLCPLSTQLSQSQLPFHLFFRLPLYQVVFITILSSSSSSPTPGCISPTSEREHAAMPQPQFSVSFVVDHSIRHYRTIGLCVLLRIFKSVSHYWPVVFALLFLVAHSLLSNPLLHYFGHCSEQSIPFSPISFGCQYDCHHGPFSVILRVPIVSKVITVLKDCLLSSPSQLFLLVTCLGSCVPTTTGAS